MQIVQRNFRNYGILLYLGVAIILYVGKNSLEYPYHVWQL